MLSYKQTIFGTYLLNQIGITDKNFAERYLKYLESMYGRSVVIECLLEEVNLKKNKTEIVEKDFKNQLFSATDLSNYRYCPVGYSIGKSFDILKPNGIEYTDIGKFLHEKLLLFRQIDSKNPPVHYNGFEIDSDPVIKEIISSELIFCGHSIDKAIFTNKNENYSGSPDYIFQDKSSRYFVVEEKFQKKSDYRKYERYFEYYRYKYQTDSFENQSLQDRLDKATNWSDSEIFFYPNHELQTLSYIRNIQDYKIEYGYLIYWFYDIENGYPYIHRVGVKRLEMNEVTENQYKLYVTQLSDLMINGKQKFEKDKLHPNKCAACVVSKYCGHKTGLIDEFSFPYNLNDLKIFQVEFPAELIKH